MGKNSPKNRVSRTITRIRNAKEKREKNEKKEEKLKGKKKLKKKTKMKEKTKRKERNRDVISEVKEIDREIKKKNRLRRIIYK